MQLALTALNVTEVAPVKFVPLMVRLVPTGPLVGAKLVIVGGSTTVNALQLALTALNVTEVAPVKFVPLMVRLVPTGPLVGAKLVIVGGSTTVNALELVAMPPGVVTLSDPVVAPAGTVA